MFIQIGLMLLRLLDVVLVVLVWLGKGMMSMRMKVSKHDLWVDGWGVVVIVYIWLRVLHWMKRNLGIEI